MSKSKLESPERNWISPEEAKEASKRALKRLKDSIVSPLNVQLNIPALSIGESAKVVSAFKLALSDPTVTNVRSAQTYLNNKYPAVAIDGQLGPRTLAAMNDFMKDLAGKARASAGPVIPIDSNSFVN